MTASDHATKPLRNTLRERGHPYMTLGAGYGVEAKRPPEIARNSDIFIRVSHDVDLWRSSRADCPAFSTGYGTSSPSLCTKSKSEPPHLPAPDAGRTPPVAADVPLHQLDVNALLRASRALSGEIELGALIRTLMQIVLEHAAAERGILFLMGNDGQPLAVAEAYLGANGINVTIRETGCRDIEFAQSALNYVVRTQTSLNSAEPANKGLLSVDSYLQRRRHISLHCLPIVSQAKLVGVLYLESHVAVGAFTPQQAAVLDLLAAQAAISLEDARLYADLRRSEAFLSDGQSISHTGSWSWEAPTGRLVWSDEHYRIFGADPRSWVPTLARIYRMIHPEDRVAVRRTEQSSVRNGAPFTCECRLICSRGVRYLHVVGRPSTDRLGGFKSYVGTTVDLSDYRRAQEALQAAQSDLAHASRLTAVGELTSLIAHEVRQPLTAIAARAGACRSWLAHDPPDISAAAVSVAVIVEYAHRANGVIESIRQMTRKSAPAQTPLDVNEAIWETVTLLQSEIRRQHVVLKVELAAGLPSVRGDRIQLQQVFMNLMMNGMEAMTAVTERPRLLRISSEMDAPGHVLVAIADAGVGLPADKMERLFEAFFTTKPNGLGVGLAICRSIVEAHGGRLWVSPNEPWGAILQFTLPAENVGSSRSE